MKLFAAIDGGGSRSELIVFGEDLKLRERRVGGALNFNEAPDAAAGALRALTQGICADFLYAGISGAGNRGGEIHKQLCGSAFGQVRVESDLKNLMLAEFAADAGCCVISGTGSSCLAKRADIGGREGGYRRIGGWGYLIDSRGSGFDIGRCAIEAVLMTFDGRASGGEALRLLWRERFGKPPEEMLSEIYDGGKRFIAGIVPMVMEAAAQGDAVSARIIDENIGAIAGMISAAADFICADENTDSCPGFRAVLTGGVAENLPGAVNAVAAKLTGELNAKKVLSVELASTPQICGAALGALAMCGIAPDHGVRDVIVSEYRKNSFQSGHQAAQTGGLT